MASFPQRDQHPQTAWQPLIGVRTVRQHNPRQWRLTLLLANAGLVVLWVIQALSRLSSSPLVPLIVVGILAVIVNAILVPIAIIQNRKTLTLDFDRGTLGSGGVTYPAEQLRALIAATRFFPGTAHLLSFQFPQGVVDVQISGFAPTPESRATNAVLANFVWQWLRIPESASVPQSASFGLTRAAIGKREALALLNG